MSSVSYNAPIKIIGKSVWLELLRRKDAYVLFIFMGLFLLGIRVVHVAGIEEEATATMLLNLSLSAAAAAAHILLIFQTARQVPDDLERKTLYVVLAHATSRTQYLLAKGLYSVFAGMLVWGVLFTMGWLALADATLYDSGLLIQLILLQITSLFMLGAWVLLGSLLFPKAVNIIQSLAFLLCSPHLNRAVFHNEAVGSGWAWFMGCLPDFSRFNLITRYTDSIPALEPSVFLGLIVYASLYIALAFTLAQVLFQRRSL